MKEITNIFPAKNIQQFYDLISWRIEGNTEMKEDGDGDGNRNYTIQKDNNPYTIDPLYRVLCLMMVFVLHPFEARFSSFIYISGCNYPAKMTNQLKIIRKLVVSHATIAIPRNSHVHPDYPDIHHQQKTTFNSIWQNMINSI